MELLPSIDDLYKIDSDADPVSESSPDSISNPDKAGKAILLLQFSRKVEIGVTRAWSIPVSEIDDLKLAAIKGASGCVKMGEDTSIYLGALLWLLGRLNEEEMLEICCKLHMDYPDDIAIDAGDMVFDPDRCGKWKQYECDHPLDKIFGSFTGVVTFYVDE